MPLIFLSYRTKNSKIGKIIHNELIRNYGSDTVFLDEKLIPKGEDIRSYIRSTLSQCKIFLCLIDSSTLDAIITLKEQHRNWSSPVSWVQIEIEEALSAIDLNVIPILIDGVAMPSSEKLREGLGSLSYRNQLCISTEHLPEDLSKLIRELNRLIKSEGYLKHFTEVNSNSKTTTLRGRKQNSYGFLEYFLPTKSAASIHMVLIPSGSFLMGSLEDNLEHSKSEYPAHKVSLSSFFMSRHPITQAQYEAVMGSKPSSIYDEDRFISPGKPVVGVSWHDSGNFCDRLAEMTGRPYRLPTEAEWEYACRAGTTTPFHFGKTLTTEVANFDGNYTYASGPKGEFLNGTTSVDHFGIANAFGLSDMHGNVSEWCQDYWHENYDNAPTDGTAWIEGGNPSYRVRRGGSWFFEPDFCRSAYRDDFGLPELSDSHIGFRVCCSAPFAFQ